MSTFLYNWDEEVWDSWNVYKSRMGLPEQQQLELDKAELRQLEKANKAS